MKILHKSFVLILFFNLLFVGFVFADASNGVDSITHNIPSASNSLIDSTILFRIDSIEYDLGGVFSTSEKHTTAEKMSYKILDYLHINTRQSVIQNSLLFKKGDSIRIKDLIESERQLRAYSFLSDAKIESIKGSQNENILRIHTSDQWSTNIPLSLKNPSGNHFEYTLGLLENNFLGFGQQIGIFASRTSLRNQQYLIYGSPHFFLNHNHFYLQLAQTSDGYAHFFSMTRPFLSRNRNEWTWSLSGSSYEKTEYIYESRKANTPWVYRDSSVFPFYSYSKIHTIETVIFPKVQEDSLLVSFSKSFGKSSLKSYVSLLWTGLSSNEILAPEYPVYKLGNRFRQIDSAQTLKWTEYKDSKPGFKYSISAIRYDRITNFRNVKWTEDLNLGWDFSLAVFRNFKELGANNSKWFYKQRAGFADRIGPLFLSATAKSQSYFKNARFDDLYERVNGTLFYRRNPSYASVWSGFADQFFHAPLQKQLTLGGDEGLSGFPYYYFAGNARVFTELEQRWYPHFEALTMLPVFAAFVQAGQVYDQMQDFDWNTLQYSVGLGLRIGMTKATTGVVNHLNISWPLNGSFKKGFMSPRFSLVAKASL